MSENLLRRWIPKRGSAETQIPTEDVFSGLGIPWVLGREALAVVTDPSSSLACSKSHNHSMLYFCDASRLRGLVELLNLHTQKFPVFNSCSVADFGICKHLMKLGRQAEWRVATSHEFMMMLVWHQKMIW